MRQPQLMVMRQQQPMVMRQPQPMVMRGQQPMREQQPMKQPQPMRQPQPGILKQKRSFEKNELILINFICNVDSKQSDTNTDNIYCENFSIVIAHTRMPVAYLFRTLSKV